MRIRTNDERDRRLEALVEAAGEKVKRKALDEAARYYVRMAGGTNAVPAGALEGLASLSVGQGSVTPGEIADTLDSDELSTWDEREWSVGEER